MKNSLLITLFLLLSLTSKADQLEWISKDQAIAAVNYLKGEKRVILFCGCCENEPLKHIKIKRVYFEPVNEDLFHVVIEDKSGEKHFLDLAYTYVKVKRNAHALGKLLHFPCDPCVVPFSWK